MQVELYADRYFLTNVCMNLLVLAIVNRSVGQRPGAGRECKAALAGAVPGLLPLFLPLSLSGRLVLGGILNTLGMLLKAYGKQNGRFMLQMLQRILIGNLLLGGGGLIVLLRADRAGAFPYWAVPTGALAVYGLMARLKQREADTCQVVLRQGQAEVRLQALVDTGNSLVEPISGKPVSVVNEGVLETLYPSGVPFERAIPYHSVGRHKGILRGVIIQEMVIETENYQRTIRKPIIAIAAEGISIQEEKRKGPGILLHPEILKQESE